MSVTDTDPEVAIMPGACINDPKEIATMRRRIHDAVIRSTGPDRRSGVTWRQWDGHDAMSVLEALYEDDERTHVPAAMEQFRAFFRDNPDSVLIIASVEAVQPT